MSARPKTGDRRPKTQDYGTQDVGFRFQVSGFKSPPSRVASTDEGGTLNFTPPAAGLHPEPPSPEHCPLSPVHRPPPPAHELPSPSSNLPSSTLNSQPSALNSLLRIDNMVIWFYVFMYEDHD